MNKFFKSFDQFHAENDFALAALHTKGRTLHTTFHTPSTPEYHRMDRMVYQFNHGLGFCHEIRPSIQRL